MTASNQRSLWPLFLPALHLTACLIGLVGYVLPYLQPLGIIWVFVMLIDLPVSAIAHAISWNHQIVAATWIIVAGTAWWYLLSLGIQRMAQKAGVVRSKGATQHSGSNGTAS